MRAGSPRACGAQSWQPQPRPSVPLVSVDLEGLRPWDFSPLDLTPASACPLVVSSMRLHGWATSGPLRISPVSSHPLDNVASSVYVDLGESRGQGRFAALPPATAHGNEARTGRLTVISPDNVDPHTSPGTPRETPRYPHT